MADEDIDMENFDERAEIASDFAADDDNEKVKAWNLSSLSICTRKRLRNDLMC